MKTMYYSRAVSHTDDIYIIKNKETLSLNSVKQQEWKL